MYFMQFVDGEGQWLEGDVVADASVLCKGTEPL